MAPSSTRSYSIADQGGYVRWQGDSVQGASAYLRERSRRPPRDSRTYHLRIDEGHRTIEHHLSMNSTGHIVVTATQTYQAVDSVPLPDFLHATRLLIPPLVYLEPPPHGPTAWERLLSSADFDEPYERLVDRTSGAFDVPFNAEEEISTAELDAMFADRR